MDSSKRHFHALDVAVFAGMLLFSAAIGVYFAYKDRKRQSTENYYFGDRNVSPIPVAISLAVSYISALTVIGVPVEVYLYGNVFSWVFLGKTVSSLIAMAYYIPLIHRLKLGSINEYLELRFHPKLRSLISVMAIIQLTLYMGITVYLPSLALSAVTPLDLKWTIALTSFICTFYTSIGGMKAVIWTDVLQGMVMLIGSLVVFVQALIIVGGFSQVADAVERGGRHTLFNFNLDLTLRTTFWTIFLGQTLNICGRTCCSQVYSQRVLSCKSVRDARIAMIVHVIPSILISVLAIGNGLLMYTYYEGCDPYMNNQVEKHDQTMPRLVIEIFQTMPGMAGLFVAAGFSGTLSSVSSGINAIAALVVIDFVTARWPDMKSSMRMLLSKIVSITFGVVVMLIAYFIAIFKSNILQTAMSITGLSSGPIFGIFTMGVFMPWTNYKGAFMGVLCGWGLSCWVALCSILIEEVAPNQGQLPLSTAGCMSANYSTEFNTSQYTIPVTEQLGDYGSSSFTEFIPMTTAIHTTTDRPILYYTLYSLSPFLYGVLGFCTCMVVGNVISILTGIDKPSKANPELFMPIVESTLLPKRVRVFLRFGVPTLPLVKGDSAESENLHISEECSKVMASSQEQENLTNEELPSATIPLNSHIAE